MICQNKILPNLGKDGVIQLTWEHFGQYLEKLKQIFFCPSNLFV
jgi:hypothetical protein